MFQQFSGRQKGTRFLNCQESNTNISAYIAKIWNLQSICMQHAILQGSGYHIPYMEVISHCFVSQSWRKWLSVYTIRSPLSDLVSGSSNVARAREWVEAVCNTASRQCSCEWPDKQHKCTSKQLALFPGPRPAFQPLQCKMERAWYITSCEHDMITKWQEWEVTLCNQLIWSVLDAPRNNFTVTRKHTTNLTDTCSFSTYLIGSAQLRANGPDQDLHS